MLLYISFIRLTTGCYTYRNSIFKHHLWYIAIVQCTQNSTNSNKLVIFSGITLYYGDTYIVLIICLVTLYYNPSLHISRFVTLPHSPILKHKLRYQTHMPMRTWKEEEDARKREQCKPFGILPKTIQLAEQTFPCLLQYFFLSLLMSITTVKFSTFRILSQCNDFKFDHTYIPSLKPVWVLMGLQ